MGSAVHEEYWIPGKQLPDFNRAIRGEIEVEGAFFGESFVGFVPENFGFKGKNATEQLVILARSWDYSRMDFVLEVSTNQKAVYVHCLFWMGHDFSRFGIEPEPKRTALAGVVEAWNYSNITPRLPAVFARAFSRT
ncbi:MAG TPA: hypothetical protein VGM18_10605 [Candidatus Sulfotelmatobacter sp.]